MSTQRSAQFQAGCAIAALVFITLSTFLPLAWLGARSPWPWLCMGASMAVVLVAGYFAEFIVMILELTRTVPCPRCGQQLSVFRLENARQVIRCPKCGPQPRTKD
jgi:DNA-directed RNA polymerase subunit RPC12/RpoP